MLNSNRTWFPVFLVALGGFLFSVKSLEGTSRHKVVEEMRVALPRVVQVLLSGGDRFLAANVATFRAVVASTEAMQEENFRVQAQLQRDAAWFNPAHEDGYFVAAAILPWNGQFDAAQEVLAAAAKARPQDWQPPFYYAFNLYQFKKDPLAAGNALLAAAPAVASENNRNLMLGLGYAWLERGYEADAALRLMEKSAESARSGSLRRYLLARAERLRQLLALRKAARKFEAIHGRPLKGLNELLISGLISSLPRDPLGSGFTVDASGNPVIKNQNTSSNQ